MAITSAAQYAGTFSKTWDVTASADADTGAFQIAHGFTAAPKLVTLVEMLPAAHVSNWVLTSIDATNITITKTSTGVGSGNASAQLRVQAQLPHSITG